MRWIIALVISSMVLVASAIEPPKSAPAPAKPPASDEPAQPAPSESPPGAPASDQASGDAQTPATDAGQADTPADEDEELPPLPADAVPAGPPPQRFTPSEKVRADFPVSFPIDI